MADHALLLVGPTGLYALCLAADLQTVMLLQKLFLSMVMSLVHSTLCSHPIVRLCITVFVLWRLHSTPNSSAGALRYSSCCCSFRTP